MARMMGQSLVVDVAVAGRQVILRKPKHGDDSEARLLGNSRHPHAELASARGSLSV